MKKQKPKQAIRVVEPLYEGAMSEAKHPDAKLLSAATDMDKVKKRYMSEIFILKPGDAAQLAAYNTFVTEVMSRFGVQMIQDPGDVGWGADGTRYHHVRWVEYELGEDQLESPPAPEEFAGPDSRMKRTDEKPGLIAVKGGQVVGAGSGRQELRGEPAAAGDPPRAPDAAAPAEPGVSPDVAGDT